MTTAEILRITRNESGKSQEYMALELGVARKTIANWEKGISEPSISMGLAWLRLCEKNPIPYLLQASYPAMDKISPKDEDAKILSALLGLIEDLPADGVRQLMYLFFGNHGSSPRAVMQMITAHLQSPMANRISHGQLIATDYEIAKQTKNLSHPEHIQPDLECLKNAIAQAKDELKRTTE